jgi:hypothetical protein
VPAPDMTSLFFHPAPAGPLYPNPNAGDMASLNCTPTRESSGYQSADSWVATVAPRLTCYYDELVAGAPLRR